jgi:hypothetical protein
LAGNGGDLPRKKTVLGASGPAGPQHRPPKTRLLQVPRDCPFRDQTAATELRREPRVSCDPLMGVTN